MKTTNPITTPPTQNTDVLIIGSGLAGLSVALNLPSSLQITLLSKDRLDKCSSYYAQGGIAGMLAPDDSVSNHVKDTLIAGDGLCHPANTGQILQQGISAIDWLCEQGVPFTQDLANANPKMTTNKQNSTDTSKLHLTREGGHSHRRIVHADDATGQHIMDTLLDEVQARPNIQLLANHEAVELIQGTITPSGKPTIRGAKIVNKTFNNVLDKQASQKNEQQTEQLFSIHAQAVVLASGGLGQMFKRATAPSVCIGDGVMMAWQAGCRLANLEFVQFHPTGLALAEQDEQARNFLISEAVRGEGGLLVCPVSGQRFMLDVDERAELAPRDIVARAIYKQGKLNGLGYVHLDISHRPPEFVKAHFPQIYQYCLTKGLDICKQPIPVAPTAHYSCGGVLTTAEGLTDVVGLYAVGEVAYTGLHGANRLASNSLLECVVVGRQIAKHLHNNVNSNIDNNIDKNTDSNIDEASHSLEDSWQYPQPQIENQNQSQSQNNQVLTVATDNCRVRKAQLNAMQLCLNPPCFNQLDSPDSLETNNNTASPISTDIADVNDKIAKLKQLMNDNMGIVRNQYELQSAYQQLEQWQFEENVSATLQQGVLTKVSITTIRWQRLLILAQLMIQSALTRQESRGGHYRNDHLHKSRQARVSVVS